VRHYEREKEGEEGKEKKSKTEKKVVDP